MGIDLTSGGFAKGFTQGLYAPHGLFATMDRRADKKATAEKEAKLAKAQEEKDRIANLDKEIAATTSLLSKIADPSQQAVIINTRLNPLLEKRFGQKATPVINPSKEIAKYIQKESQLLQEVKIAQEQKLPQAEIDSRMAALTVHRQSLDHNTNPVITSFKHDREKQAKENEIAKAHREVDSLKAKLESGNIKEANSIIKEFANIMNKNAKALPEVKQIYKDGLISIQSGKSAFTPRLNKVMNPEKPPQPSQAIRDRIAAKTNPEIAQAILDEQAAKVEVSERVGAAKHAQEQADKFNTIGPVIEKIQPLVDDLFKANTFSGRISESFKNIYSKITQAGDRGTKFAVYNATVDGTISLFRKLIAHETGVMTDADADRIRGLFPDAFGVLGLPDSEATAQAKMKTFTDELNKLRREIISRNPNAPKPKGNIFEAVEKMKSSSSGSGKGSDTANAALQEARRRGLIK